MPIYMRPLISIAILVSMIILELIVPRRSLESSRTYRWSINFGLALINYVVLKWIHLDLAYTTAEWAENNHFGLLNLLEMGHLEKIISTIIILDLVIYFQHIVFHKIQFFWNLHKIHHCDTDYDTTTAIRFHPIEIILSMLIKMLFISLIGGSPLGVIIFEIILNGCALFNHANIFIPLKFEKYIRLILVTPDMHRIHHSAEQCETDSNFGFSITIWDRIFKTYVENPKQSHSEMKIGLNNFPHPFQLNIIKVLLLPFVKLKNK